MLGLPCGLSPCPPDCYCRPAGRRVPNGCGGVSRIWFGFTKAKIHLRTVIVTAAVYRGFGSPLRPEGLTGPLNLPAPGRRQTLYVLLTSSQSPVFLVNSRYPLLSATPSSSGSKSLHHQRHTFSRSYGVNLPSSLTRVLSSALACSAHLPVLVCGTVTRSTPYEAFLGSMGSPTL